MHYAQERKKGETPKTSSSTRRNAILRYDNVIKPRQLSDIVMGSSSQILSLLSLFIFRLVSPVLSERLLWCVMGILNGEIFVQK